MRVWTATEHASPALRARRLVITNSWVRTTIGPGLDMLFR
jgi:hypothetical protein